jgi:hypothetical protein
MRDGASDEWLEEGEATPIMPEHNKFNKFRAMSDSFTDDVDDEVIGSKAVANQLSLSKWHIFLGPGEKQLFTGLVWKRKVCYFRST